MEERKCNKCEVTKPIDDFYRSNRKGDKRPDERSYECKECTKARVTANKDPDKDRNQHLVRTYGITSEEYDVMLAKQDGHCATCSTTVPGNSRRNVYFSVDHCHTTGKVRGLLCHNCNTALGLLKDNTDTIANLIRYLA